MPAGPGSVDANGSWQFGEADDEGIFSDTLNLAQAAESAKFAAIDLLFLKHQIQTFVWANAAARTAQTGMSNGDWGYQTDTAVLYRRVGGAWKAWTSDWITYTPGSGGAGADSGFAIGTGGTPINIARYRYVDGMVKVNRKVRLGTSGASVSAVIVLGLPFNFDALVHSYQMYDSSGDIFDNSATDPRRAFAIANVAAVNQFRVGYHLVTGTGFDYASNTLPWLWAANDSIQITMTGDAA